MQHNPPTPTLKILRLDSSARYAESVSRQLTDHLVAQLLQAYPDAQVTPRDLAVGLPLPTEAYVDGSLYAIDNPSPTMQAATQLSDTLVAELLAADIVVLGLPVYNWTIPSTFKTYVDYISRLGVTFAYDQGVSKGLLRARHVYVVLSSGGTGIGSATDFATPYTSFLWQTLGIPQLTYIDATGLLFQAETVIERAKRQIEQLALPEWT